jgi:hypothetical protein
VRKACDENQFQIAVDQFPQEHLVVIPSDQLTSSTASLGQAVLLKNHGATKKIDEKSSMKGCSIARLVGQ